MNQEDGSGNVRIERLVRRYDCVTSGDAWGMGCYGSMEEDQEFGDWVKWDEVKPLLERLRELEEKVKRMKSENGYPTFEDLRMAAERERRRLVPIVYEWAFPSSKPEQHEEDMKELAEAMGVEVDFWDGRTLEIAEDRKGLEVVCPKCGHKFEVDCVY